MGDMEMAFAIEELLESTNDQDSTAFSNWDGAGRPALMVEGVWPGGELRVRLETGEKFLIWVAKIQ